MRTERDSADKGLGTTARPRAKRGSFVHASPIPPESPVPPHPHSSAFLFLTCRKTNF